MEQKSVWGGVTDPSQHNEKDFRYLVHAFNPLARATISLTNAIAATPNTKRAENPEIDRTHGDQSINLYEQPERLAERVSLSMSLIDQDHRATWGDSGIIVEAPTENVLITKTQDAGSMNSDPSALRQQAHKHFRFDGDALLKSSSPSCYNEVVAFSSIDDSRLAIKGVFYKVTSKGEPVDADVAAKMEVHARRLGVPIVKIKAISQYTTDEILERGEGLAAYLDGSRYELTGYKNSFHVTEECKRPRFIKPEELTPVLQFLMDRGFSEDRIATIRQAYAAADKAYHKAKFDFDANGEVYQLQKIQGYGALEQKYSVYSKGTANVVRTDDHMRQIKKSLLGDHGQMKVWEGNNIYRPVGRRTVEEMIEEAKEGLSPAQLLKVEEWATKILPDVEQKSQSYFGNTGLRSIMGFSDKGGFNR